MFKKILLTIAISALILPAVAMAQNGDEIATFSPDTLPGIPSLINTFIQYALGIVVLIAVVMIIYGGFKMITSQGDSEGFNKGRDMVVYAIIGLIVAFIAWGLVNWVLGTIGAGEI